MKKAVVLFNLGGPDSLDNVEPFLFNLFNDPAIINLPTFIRYPLAKIISKKRAPVAKKISKEIDITIQGGLDPKILLTDKENLKKKTHNYLEIFRDKPYIFNLGHGVLPETDPMMVDYLVKYVKNFK